VFVHIPIPGHERPVLLFCFVFTLCIGAYELYRGLSAGSCKQVNAAVIEHGNPAPGVWLRVRGRALWSDASKRSDEDGYVVYMVPVVSDEPEARKHAALFMEYRLKAQPPPSGQTDTSDFDGTIIRGRGLAPDDQTQLGVRGITRASQYLLLKPGGTPRDLMGDGYLFLTIAAACLAFIPVIGWLKRFERRQISRRRSTVT
jgi:hypothetical protein